MLILSLWALSQKLRAHQGLPLLAWVLWIPENCPVMTPTWSTSIAWRPLKQSLVTCKLEGAGSQEITSLVWVLFNGLSRLRLVPVLCLWPIRKSVRAHHGHLLPSWTPESFPGKTAAWTNTGFLSSPKPRVISKLGGIESMDVTRVEWVGLIEPMNIQIWSCGRGLNRGTMAAFPPALALKLHNSVYPCMSLVIVKERLKSIIKVLTLKI